MVNPVKAGEIQTSTTALVAERNNSNVNNDNQKIANNDINVNNGGKYTIDRSKFIPNTSESQFAEEIAVKLNDLTNYACYRDVIQHNGIANTMRCFKSVLNDIKEKKETKTPVRYPAKYFMWKLKKRLY
jgi:hypothetical protein